MKQSSFLSDQSTEPSGCYLRNPQNLGLNKKRSFIPLNHIDYELQIVNGLLHLRLSQVYINPSSVSIDVDYSFPLSPSSSVYRFKVKFGSVEIDGIVKQKQAAYEEFQEAKKSGKQAVIGSIDPLSKDIMNLQIGNIPPSTQFHLQISYVQEMAISMNSFYYLIIPSKISPRYVEKMMEKNQGKNKNQKSDFTWSFKIQLYTTRKVILSKSSSHEIYSLIQNEQRQIGYESVFVMSQAERPNKDFQFRYSTENFHLPSYVIGKTEQSTTVMLSFVPKFCNLDINDAYQASIENKDFQTDINSAKGEYIFLLDRSQSMEGSRIQNAKQALILFLKSLPEDSYFNVLSFGSKSEIMFHYSQKYNANLINEASKKICQMKANFGGTVIYGPLKMLLQAKSIDGYPKHIFLLTDGAVTNTEQVINLVNNNNKFSRVHSIGVGSGASPALIKGCAEAGKGRYVFITKNENPSDKIIQLLQTTLTPLITELKMRYNESNVESIFPNPKKMPIILKDDVVNFYVTYKGHLTSDVQFRFQYTDSANNAPYAATIKVNFNSQYFPFVDKMSHYKVIKSLEQLFKNKEQTKMFDKMIYAKVRDYRIQAIKQSIKHQVLSEYTSFLCVSNSKNGSKQNISKQQMPYQSRQKSSAVERYQKQLNPIHENPYMFNNFSSDTVIGSGPSKKTKLQKLSFSLERASDNNDNQSAFRLERAREDGNSDDQEQPEYTKDKSQKKDISQLINIQHPNGSWSEKQLINKLGQGPDQLHKLGKKIGYQVVITQLVVGWIQIFYPQKQYNLILKKALSWIKKTIKAKGIDIGQLSYISPSYQ